MHSDLTNEYEVIVESMTKDDLNAVAALTAKAFLTNPGPHILEMWPISFEKALKRSTKMFKVILDQSWRINYVAKINNKPVGVLSCVHSDQFKLGFKERAKMIVPFLLAVRGSFIRLLKFHNASSKLEPTQEHYHVGPVCVAPGYQGKGIGSKLLSEYQKLQEKKGIGGYLETGKIINIKLYERYGFKLVGDFDFYSTKLWTMWRE
ncbi:MAG: GNAT family N-acetyltransferase [Flavobacteriales bacterium]|nr:GNAT family N-acetyltransferase [Flavobacteriales bacterium]